MWAIVRTGWSEVPERAGVDGSDLGNGLHLELVPSEKVEVVADLKPIIGNYVRLTSKLGSCR
ncbi:MAG: hypothetical protein C0482_24380 [Gordonia sp.]|nr:hypothetical protein [Gordonia sp. (in: high G+C Gram-positive bacteria)]